MYIVVFPHPLTYNYILVRIDGINVNLLVDLPTSWIDAGCLYIGAGLNPVADIDISKPAS